MALIDNLGNQPIVKEGGLPTWEWLQFFQQLQVNPTVVDSLPSAGSVPTGTKAFVTDATATIFHSIVAGGGANAVPVFADGSGNWRIG
jgi:hypothetical protein